MPCDTFVITFSDVDKPKTIFAKNSDRPGDEIQEVIAVKGSKNTQEKLVKVSFHLLPVSTDAIILDNGALQYDWE